MKKTVAILTGALMLAAAGSVSAADKPFYNETMGFTVTVRGTAVGNVYLKSEQKSNGYLYIDARVLPHKIFKSVYYVQGRFGAKWNYKSQRSYIAYEDIYQGPTYQRRSFKFSGNRVLVKKLEKKFSESGYPHSGKLKDYENKKYWVTATGYSDLLGAFYKMRSQGKSPRIGQVQKLKVLPAGQKRYLIIKVLNKKTINVPALGGKKRVMYVKSGLLNPDKSTSGGDIFLKTKSPIYMYITDDENYIPVKIWTKVPVIGTAYLNLTNYSQN